MPDKDPAHIFKHQKACAKTSNTLCSSRIVLYSTGKEILYIGLFLIFLLIFQM